MTGVISFGSTDLTTIGYVNLLDYLDIPDRRGGDQVIPFQNGELHVPKFYGSRVFTVGLTISAANLAAMETAMDTLRALIAIRTRQTLSLIMQDASVRTAQAIINKRINFKGYGPRVAKMTLEFAMAQPFFRLSTEVADNTVIVNASPKAWTVNNPGSIEEREATIVIDGPFSAVTIANATTSTSMTYTGAIGASETVTIAKTNGQWTAILSTGSANVIGGLTHTGDSDPLVFAPGNNTCSITSSGGDNSGTCRARFYAPYF